MSCEGVDSAFDTLSWGRRLSRWIDATRHIASAHLEGVERAQLADADQLVAHVVGRRAPQRVVAVAVEDADVDAHVPADLAEDAHALAPASSKDTRDRFAEWRRRDEIRTRHHRHRRLLDRTSSQPLDAAFISGVAPS